MDYGRSGVAAIDRLPTQHESQGIAQGRSSQEFTEEALQPALTDSSIALDSPTAATQLNNSEQLPAPTLDLTLLSDPQAQSIEDSQVKQVSLVYLFVGCSVNRSDSRQGTMSA